MSDSLNGNVGQNSAVLDSTGDQPDFADFSSDMRDFYATDEEMTQTPDLEVNTETAEKTDDVPNERTEAKEAVPEVVDTEAEKPSRTSAFNQLKEEVVAITTERDTLQAQVEQFNTVTERYGGIENFLALEEQFVGVLLDPAKTNDAVQLIQGLSNGPQIVSEIMFDSVGLTLDGQAKQLDEPGLQTVIQNQALVVNRMLQGYQGVEANISPEELEDLGEYLALQLSENREAFLAEIRRNNQLYVDPKDKEIRRLQAEVNAKKATPKQEQEAEQIDPFQQNLKIVEDFKEFHHEVTTKTFTEKEDATKPSVAEKYRIADDEKLKPEIRKANTLLQEMVQTYVQVKMDSTEAQGKLLNYLAKTPKTHPTFPVASLPYKNAVRAHVETILRTLNPRINGTISSLPPTPQKQTGGLQPDTTNGLTPTAEKSNGDWEDWGNFN